MYYIANNKRYESMQYRRCGKSGLKLPAVSLGLWHNFGGEHPHENSRSMLHTAFDLGITHFDLANNYGPPPGSAEETFGKIFNDDLKKYRNELIISTKAGYYMWPGPYGEWGSAKYLLSSLDESLQRMKLDYVDIFYSHRPDLETPLEETMSALERAYRQGKALYVGISSYNADYTKKAAAVLQEKGIKCLIHQPSYSMLNRWVEDELLETLENLGIGCIAFCPLHQGILTGKYLNGIPEDSRASNNEKIQEIAGNNEILEKITKLNEIAADRGQSLAQLALAWLYQDPRVTSVLIGASRPEQITENVQMLENTDFTSKELGEIEAILK